MLVQEVLWVCGIVGVVGWDMNILCTWFVRRAVRIKWRKRVYLLGLVCPVIGTRVGVEEVDIGM